MPKPYKWRRATPPVPSVDAANASQIGKSRKSLFHTEEYAKKTDTLRKKVIDYQASRRSSIDKITRQRAEARQNLLNQMKRSRLLILL